MTEQAEQRDERAALAPREVREMPYLRAIPRPTPWPIITAFGVTFMFAAIVTNIFVVVVGAAFALVGVIGWFREVFPHENVEAIPVADCETPLPPPEFAPRPEKTSTRNVVPERIHPYRSGVKGAIAGAIAMAVVAAGWGLIDAGSLWLPSICSPAPCSPPSATRPRPSSRRSTRPGSRRRSVFTPSSASRWGWSSWCRFP
jgi:hypothetical protein